MKFSITKKILVIILIIILVGMTLFPVIWMVSSSLKVDEEIYKIPPTWIPEKFTLDHYSDLFSRFHFGRYLPNSAIIAISTTIISVMLGLLAAYGFSRYSFPGCGALLFVMLLVRLFTPAAFVVPLYDMMRWLGLVDTLLAIMIGVTIMNLPFVVWIMKVFFDDFPKELEDAAKLDGMSSLRILASIILPLATPAVATVALFSFNVGWNDFLFSLSFSQTTRSMTATVGIASMDTGYKVYWGAMMAGGAFLSMPIVMIAFVLQKYFVKGLTMGSSR